MSTRPILKWPGGKRWLTACVAPILSAELRNSYYEPFVGGGAMYLAIRPSSATLSDSNPELVEFYQTCAEDAPNVVRAARRNSNTEADYYAVRNSAPRKAITKAGRFLYLNRTCWGGVYRLNRAGRFNVPFGNNGRRICTRAEVLCAAEVFSAASFLCCDFAEAFAAAGSGDVVFADPPYTSKGQFNGFVRYNEKLFSWKDQVRLSEVSKSARSRGAFVAVCGSYHRDILALYQNWWVLPLKRSSRVARNAENRGAVFECLIVSRKPKIEPCGFQRITPELIEHVPHHED